MIGDIRLAGPGDAPALSTLLALVFAHAYAANIPADTLVTYLARAFNPTTLARQLDQPASSCWLSYSGDALIGCAWINPHPPVDTTTATLDKMYVLPAHQGTGIGGRLLSAAINGARQQGFARMQLAVWRGNPGALAFYSRHGFSIQGETVVMVDHICFDDLVLMRALTHDS